MSEDYIKEKALKGHSKAKSIEAIKIGLEQMEKSICKIKCNDGGSGTGFFLNIINFNEWNSLPIKVFVTNNHASYFMLLSGVCSGYGLLFFYYIKRR